MTTTPPLGMVLKSRVFIWGDFALLPRQNDRLY